ncbi:hypothetical protein [Castellaniella defragrans]|uniref:hypothetical protein n=1 Tax=Castellaniella defragrans TaxID=75697 RepID=UPI0023F38DAC|nr:hypothetical protein [Castellaniella defragrans]
MTSPLAFTPAEADLLGRTADALCAYLGKPVIAEIVAEPGEGYEWALFALPLAPDDANEDKPRVQAGGPGARFLGSSGGLDLSDGQPVDCEFLWAVQLSDLEGVRYIKVDAQGEEVAWTDTLTDLLPFDLREAEAPEDEGEEADDEGNEEEDKDGEGQEGEDPGGTPTDR